MQHHAGLREAQPLVNQDPDFSHLVDAFPPFRRAGLPAKEIDINRGPIERPDTSISRATLYALPDSAKQWRMKSDTADATRGARAQNGNGDSNLTPLPSSGGVCATFNTIETVVK